MRLGIFIAIGVLVLANIYVDHGLIGRWPGAAGHLASISLGGFALFVVQLTGPFGDRLGFPRWRHGRFGALVAAADWLSYFVLGVMSCLMLYVLAADIVATAWQLIAPPSDSDAFNRHVVQAVAVLTAATSALGVWQARQPPRVRRVEVPLAGLPASFDGFTIAQISDLHLGPTIGRAFAARVAQTAQALNPDLIALTGDFGDGRAADLANDLAPLRDLHAPHGVYYITGNHEYYWHAEEWMATFRGLGATVLANTHRLVEKDGAQMVLAGVTDYSAGRMHAEASDPAKALAGAPPDLVRILLAHQPASYRKAAEAGYHLQLSGHTHGGQYFPFSLLIRFFQRYYRGLNRHDGRLWVYVSTGAGYWGPPLRTFVPPEIALLTLRAV